MKFKNLLFACCILFFSITNALAQGEGNFWYFGSQAGLDFNSGSPVALTDGVINTSEGCATISSAAGNLLFYTDGITVWNKLHAQMPNGFSLLGDPSATQSGIIVPKPGSSNIYYVFTVPAQGGGGLHYSEVNMSLAGGLGDVTTLKNVPLALLVNEKVTAVKKANNVDFWVIAHDFTTNTFFVYSITSAGVNAVPVTSTAGTVDISSYGIGYLKASTDGSKLVQAIWTMQVTDILNFNTTTGIVSSDFTIPTLFADADPYGVEFSPDGKRLYIADGGSDWRIFQYDMTLASPAAIIASATVIGTSISPTIIMGGLQIGPDGKIYVARYNAGYLGCINNPNTLGIACNYVDDAVYLLGRISNAGLPNFIQTFFIGAPIQYVNTCVGDTTFFSMTDSVSVDSLHWNFGDPASGTADHSGAYSPYHIYNAAGTYNVSLITYLGSLSDTSFASVTITSGPIVAIGNDTSVCAGTPVNITLNAGTGYTYGWQDGSSGSTFHATSVGTYYVNASNACGIATDTIHITAIPLPLVTTANTAICAGETANLSAGGATTYSWSTGAIPTVTGAATATAAPFLTTTYTVTGTSGGCSATSTATVTVHQLPTPNFTATATAGCAPFCMQFHETVSTSCVTQTYTFGDGTTDSNPSPTHCYTLPGVYSVGISCTDAFGCTGTTSVTNMISVFGMPQANFSMSPSGTGKTHEPVTFINASTNGAAIFVWIFGDATSGAADTSYLFSPTHTYEKEGTYCTTLITYTTDGCSDTASECITIIGDITIPNVFTPNGDGSNDLFVVKNLNPGMAPLKIYNRWGVMVYETSGYNNDWSGKDVSDGVYYYILEYGGKTFTGYVQVIGSR